MLCGARGLRRALFDVYPRRRIPRGQRGPGRHLCQAERFRIDVRLHSYGSNFRRFGRAIHYRLDERVDGRSQHQPLAPTGSDGSARPPLPVRHELHVRGICGRGHHLLLVAEHQGDRRVQRQSTARHADHHCDGGDSAAVGRFFRHGAGRSPSSAANSVKSQIQRRCAGIPQGNSRTSSARQSSSPSTASSLPAAPRCWPPCSSPHGNGPTSTRTT